MYLRGTTEDFTLEDSHMRQDWIVFSRISFLPSIHLAVHPLTAYPSQGCRETWNLSQVAQDTKLG